MKKWHKDLTIESVCVSIYIDHLCYQITAGSIRKKSINIEKGIEITYVNNNLRVLLYKKRSHFNLFQDSGTHKDHNLAASKKCLFFLKTKSVLFFVLTYERRVVRHGQHVPDNCRKYRY